MREEKIIIKPEYFKRSGVDWDNAGEYSIFLQFIDDSNKQSALDVVKRAGGFEQDFTLCTAWFKTKDLPALCKRIEQIANSWYCGDCGVKSDEKDKLKERLDDICAVCAMSCADCAMSCGGRVYFDPENKDDMEKMHKRMLYINKPCKCGSGKKFKYCCISKEKIK